MKINCPKCKKPFQISSKRLAGQVVKIRCSSCGTVFKVRGRARTPAVSDGTTAAPPAAATPAEAPAAQEASRPTAVPAVAWFAVVGRKRVGPFGEMALQRLVRGGKVLPSTKLWRKGLDAWAPAGDIDELRTWFPAAEPVAASAPASAPAPTPAKPLAPPPPPLPPKPLSVPPEPEPSPEHAPTRSPESTDEALGDWHEDSASIEQDEEAAAGFFEAGEEVEDPERKMEAIDFGEPEIEPISFEEAGVARGARETLRDFSVMARLSGRSRRRKTVILMFLGVFFAGALAAVYVGLVDIDTGKRRDLTREQSDEDFAIFAKQSASGNQSLVNRSNVDQPKVSTGDLLNDEEEWGTLDDFDLAALEQQLLAAGIVKDVAIDREHMRKSFEKGLEDKKGDGRRKTPRKDEMTHWGDASSRVGGDRSAIGLSDMVPHSTRPKTHVAEGIAITAKSKVVDRVATAGGGFLGDGSITEDRVNADVKERKSSGKLWKLRAKTKVMRKVRAQTRKIKTCADVAQVDSGVKIFLHVGLDGRVSSISSTKGGSRFTGCLMDLFGNFRVVERRLKKRIKMPVILRFE